MKRIYKYFSWIICLAVLLSIGYYLFIHMVFSGVFDKNYSAAEAIQNFNEREEEIMDLADYFRKQLPADHEVSFSGMKLRFDLSIGLPRWAVMEKFPNKHGSNLKINSADANIFLSEISWTSSTVTSLAKKLEKTNCLNISSNDGVITLHFRSGTWSSYSYIIYEKPVSDSLRNVYDSSGIRMLSDNVKLAVSHAL